MKKKLKVNDVLATGRKMVIFPVAIIVFGTIGFVSYLVVQKQLPEWVFPLALVSALVAGWICWRWMVARWKAWAFPNVKNNYQLTKRAAQEPLLWPSVGFFDKPVAQLHKPDHTVLGVDSDIPKETVIYYSKSKNLAEMALFLCFVVVGILVMLFSGSNGYNAGYLVLMGVILATLEYREATNTEAQIVINHSGIRTIATTFKSWQEISNEAVKTVGAKGTNAYLGYDFPGGSEYLKIDDYNVEAWQLEVLLRVYRERHAARP